MNGWKLTRVWEIDHKLVVANTIEDAIKVFKSYMGENYTEPKSIKAISSPYLKNYDALIKEERE